MWPWSLNKSGGDPGFKYRQFDFSLLNILVRWRQNQPTNHNQQILPKRVYLYPNYLSTYPNYLYPNYQMYAHLPSRVIYWEVWVPSGPHCQWTVTLYNQCGLFLLCLQWLHHSSMAQGWDSTVFSLSSLAISNYPWHQPSAITQILLKSNCSSLLPWPLPRSKRLSFLMWTTVKFSNMSYSPSSFDPQSILYSSARTGFSNHIVDGITQLLKA